MPSQSIEPEKCLAKLRGFDVGIEDHGCFVMHGTFEYEDSGAQGLGYVINTEFIKKFIAVFRAERLQQVNGKSCWVTHTFDKILKIEPLHKKDGVVFDIVEWSKDCEKKYAK